MSLAETQGDVDSTIRQVFETYLAALGEGTEAYEEAYNALVNVMDDLLGETVMNIGQNLDKFKNTISSFYEKANE